MGIGSSLLGSLVMSTALIGSGWALPTSAMQSTEMQSTEMQSTQADSAANPQIDPETNPQTNPQTIAQVDPNTGFTGVQVPAAAVKPVNGTVDIYFINETGATIDYQVIGDTQYRSLAGRSEMRLENLKIPTTFTFRRADNGFLQVSLYPNSPTGTLTLRVRETADFAADRTSVYIDEKGGVFLN